MEIFPVFLPHAGCRHRCLFCDQGATAGSGAVPSPQEVATWLERTLPARGEGDIAFYGGTFAALPAALRQDYLAAARRCVVQGRAAGIRISTRPDSLSAENAAQLAASGVTRVEIGAQSFDDRVLEASRRGHSRGDILGAAAACRRAGLAYGLQLMPGLPGAGRAEALASLQAALATRPAFLRIYPTLVCRGTGLAELWRQGRFQPLELDTAVDIVAEQSRLCGREGVPIIRTGLQNSPQLEASLLAGPYHPAFGQLVKSRLWRRALATAAGPRQTVRVNGRDLADALGHRRENLLWLHRAIGLAGICSDERVERGWFAVAGPGGETFSMPLAESFS